MDTIKSSTKKTTLNYGVLLGVASALFGVIIYATGNIASQNWVHNLVGFVIIVTTIILGLAAYKKENGGYLVLGDALKTGIGIALIGGIISVLWTILLMTVIDPDIITQILENQKTEMIEQFPDMSQEQMDQSLEIAKKFTSPFIISAFAMIFNLFIGFIVSLIAGLIMQKKEELY